MLFLFNIAINSFIATHPAGGLNHFLSFITRALRTYELLVNGIIRSRARGWLCVASHWGEHCCKIIEFDAIARGC